ncbi:unnamed protein product [Pieris macdunnoughi]|uniref:Uncharacterized protein n=1 Tax=Pieris macdunnoughi TaxID=345717 RepID=A0A821WMN6_9NEOP|nr:unnamed protein product [Pieris macdunnoughi]
MRLQRISVISLARSGVRGRASETPRAAASETAGRDCADRSGAGMSGPAGSCDASAAAALRHVKQVVAGHIARMDNNRWIRWSPSENDDIVKQPPPSAVLEDNEEGLRPEVHCPEADDDLLIHARYINRLFQL